MRKAVSDETAFQNFCLFGVVLARRISKFEPWNAKAPQSGLLLGHGDVVLIHHLLELLRSVEGHHATGANLHFLARLGIAARARGFVPKLEIAEAGNLDLLARGKAIPYFVEKQFDEILGVEFGNAADVLNQNICKFCFSQSHVAHLTYVLTFVLSLVSILEAVAGSQSDQSFLNVVLKKEIVF